MEKKDLLVVVSKAKKYTKEKHGMVLGEEACQTLTEKVQKLIDEAIDKAKSDHRKVIKPRDIE